MEILTELLAILEEKEKNKKGKPSKSMRQKVYHADYMKTRNKPYRSYDAQERSKED